MRAMQDQVTERADEPEPPRDLGRVRVPSDPLSIALVVFFVGLIAVVVILLAAPVIAG